jgi:hypothetical protein
MSSYSKLELSLFRKLSTPAKIQDYLNSIPFNFDKGSYCMSPRDVIKNKKAHCAEGAIFAASVLEYHGHKPLILDLRSTEKPYDYDHVVAVYKKDNFWGAISKTNHGVLRYREPVYKTIRELVMSYFHEYFLDTGVKTLREYSVPFDLSKYKKLDWRTSLEDISEILEHLDNIKHNKILLKDQIKNLRKADKIEVEMGKLKEYKEL